MEKEQPTRKKNRLSNYDYSNCGAYFLTICTAKRVNCFWCEIPPTVGASSARPLCPQNVELSAYGKIADDAIKKVVIPVAGWGTRSLPASKNIPKEMLPIYNKPVIQYVVEEAQRSGVEDVIFVTNRDKSVIEDVKESIDYLRAQQGSNGKVGVIGMCSGGRHSFLAACTLEGIDAAVDCWGGQVIAKEEELDEKRPVAPIDYADGLSCPLLGIFGNDDRFPPKEDVDKTEEILKKLGKQYEFYRYDDAGHGIWYYDKPMYRQEQAMDSWNKTLEFFGRYLK